MLHSYGMNKTTQTDTTAMTSEQAREIFDRRIAEIDDPDKQDDLRLVREYFCNPLFRRALADLAWRRCLDCGGSGQEAT